MTPFLDRAGVTLYVCDVREGLAALPDYSVHCIVTSPPYWGLRHYGVDGQIGLEPTLGEYVELMTDVFREARRVLRSDGTAWVNLGDSYAGAAGGFLGKNGQRASRTFTARIKIDKGGDGIKPKDLFGVPWRVALAMQADGWYLRSDIVWHKPNPMPESVTDRPTKAHEYVFLLTKSARYYYDADAVRERAKKSEPHAPDKIKSPHGQGFTRRASGGVSSAGYDERKWRERSDGLSRPPMTMRDREYHPLGRNARTVWTIATTPYPEAHFATYPEELAARCILAGCPEGGVVLDPFAGSGTTLAVAARLGRRAVGIELNPEYARLASRRLAQGCLVAGAD